MYMVHQRVTTAVREGYREADADVLAAELARARQALAWLQGLAIDPDVRAWLTEPLAVLEEAFSELTRRKG
jgi:hypothetical protein